MGDSESPFKWKMKGVRENMGKKTMSRRERVLTTLEHREPDRVPTGEFAGAGLRPPPPSRRR